ncbi:hypothetical protein EJA05_15250 [Pseudomonas oryziphila]|uniref:Uncharacterized protein n=1 Tax=Pseudomonas entomophila TaxID=312306 RepID=A0A3Q8U132_9PSED|nr:hypothetical protein EJA05_15250 [Pseudomonas oryziphila]
MESRQAPLPPHLTQALRQGWRRYFHRNIWPETNVGAAVRRCDLPAMRRAGGARFSRRCNCVDVRLAAY